MVRSDVLGVRDDAHIGGNSEAPGFGASQHVARACDLVAYGAKPVVIIEL